MIKDSINLPHQMVMQLKLHLKPHTLTSGLLDYTKNVVIGYLHKALKTANQLSMMEDALVIYRISRAQKEGYSTSM